MSEYRKKPVVIQAHRWDPQQKPTEIPDWLWNHLAAYPDNFNETTGCFDIVTLEGAMTAQPGDWIIKGVKGELYPCKPDIFEMTYEEVPHD